MSGLRRRLTEDADGDDPLLSVVNLIDVFLVLIAALLLAVAKNPLNPVAAADSRAVTSFWSARQRVAQNTTAVAEGSHNGSGAAGWKLTVVLAQADSSAPVRRAGVARARHVEMDMQQISVSVGRRGLQALSMLGAAPTRPQPG